MGTQSQARYPFLPANPDDSPIHLFADMSVPDFAVGVKDRMRGGGVLLLETKGGHLLNSDETVEKVVAVHKTYGPPVMLKRRDDGSLWIVRYIASRNRVEEDQAFRVENMAQY